MRRVSFVCCVISLVHLNEPERRTPLLSSVGKPLGQSLRQSGGENLLLRGSDIVVQATYLNRSVERVVDDVGALGIVIARLTDGTDIDEIFLTRLGLELGIRSAAYDAVFDKSDGHMRVTKEANGCVLVSEAGGGGEFVEHVTPALRAIERGVNDGEIGHHARVLQVTQPLTIILGELSACPIDGFGGGGVEAFEMLIAGTVFVVVAFDAGHVHRANDVETFLGIGVVADNISEAGVMRHLLLLAIFEHDLKRFEIAVDVGYDSKLHVNYFSMAKPLNPPEASVQLASSFLMLAANPAS